MVQRHGMSSKAARRLLGEGITNGMVTSEMFDSDSKSRGLKVLTWPG